VPATRGEVALAPNADFAALLVQQQNFMREVLQQQQQFVREMIAKMHAPPAHAPMVGGPAECGVTVPRTAAAGAARTKKPVRHDVPAPGPVPEISEDDIYSIVEDLLLQRIGFKDVLGNLPDEFLGNTNTILHNISQVASFPRDKFWENVSTRLSKKVHTPSTIAGSADSPHECRRKYVFDSANTPADQHTTAHVLAITWAFAVLSISELVPLTRDTIRGVSPTTRLYKVIDEMLARFDTPEKVADAHKRLGDLFNAADGEVSQQELTMRRYNTALVVLFVYAEYKKRAEAEAAAAARPVTGVKRPHVEDPVSRMRAAKGLPAPHPPRAEDEDDE
jgi:hypothetical protein